MRKIIRIFYICPLLAFIISASSFPIFADSSVLPKALSTKGAVIELGNVSEYRPRIALVLSGGGARGFAQIGVLQEFEKAQIKLDYITGTSIGAVLGGLYASGYSATELDSIVSSTNWNNVFAMRDDANRNEYFLDQKHLNDRSILTFRFNNFKFIMPEAISMGIKYTYFLQNLLWNGSYQPTNSFDDLKYKFRAVATDVLSGEAVSFKSGNIVSAVKASSTLPLRYTPIRLNNMILVDGGILANVPTQQALEFSPDMIIAVRSSSPLYAAAELDKPWNLADQVVSVAMKKFEKESEKLADFVLVPQINFHKNSDFQAIDTVVEQGRKEARRQINRIKESIAQFQDSVINSKLKNLYAEMGKHSKVKFSSVGLIFSDSIKIQSLNLFYSREALENSLKSFSLYKSIKIIFELECRSPDDSSLRIRIEAERYGTIAAVTLCSDYHNITDRIQDSINYKFPRIVQSPAAICKTKELVLKQLSRAGYNLCSFDSSESGMRNDTLYLHIIIPQISSINICGNNNISSSLIHRDITAKMNDFINADKLCQSWENIFNTGWFSYVDLRLEMSHDQKSAEVFLTVKELGTQIVSLGLRLDEERKTRVGLDIIQENLFNFGTRINTRLIAGERDLAANLIVEQSRFMDTYLTFRVHSYYQFKEFSRYSYSENFGNGDFSYIPGTNISTQSYGVKVSAGSQLEKNGRIGVEARFEKQRYHDTGISDDDKPSFYSLNTIKFETVFDSEEKADFAVSGRVIALSLETNLLSTGSTRAFSKAILQYKENHSIGNHTIMPAVFFGFADVSTPFPELFDLGGQDDFFGLLKDQEKGRQIARAQLEYRYKAPFSIFFDTYFSFRYDLGAVWIVPEAIRFSELKHGLGGTIGFDTPVGPAKFSIGKSFFFTKSPTKIIYGPLAMYYSIGIRL